MKMKSERLKRFAESDARLSIFVVILGFIVATLIIVCMGRNPGGMYKAIIQVLTGWNIDRGTWNARYIGEFLNYSVPYILCGFSMAFAGRVGLFNVGGEGQYIIGMTFAQMLAVLLPPMPLAWLICLVVAVVCSAFWGGIVGYLKARFEVSEVVTTIMLNYVALYLSRILTMSLPGTSTFKTVNFQPTATLHSDFLSAITNKSNLNYGIFIMILCALLFHFLMEKTKLGFSLRATGFNKDAAHYAGMPIIKSIVIAMAISGAFAGLGGGIVALGSFKNGRVLSAFDNYGFAGIAVALVGNNKALGTVLTGFLFGMLQAAQTLMQTNGIPKEITYIIQGLVVVFIALKEGAKMLAQRMEARAEQKADKASSKVLPQSQGGEK